MTDAIKVSAWTGGEEMMWVQHTLSIFWGEETAQKKTADSVPRQDNSYILI